MICKIFNVLSSFVDLFFFRIILKAAKMCFLLFAMFTYCDVILVLISCSLKKIFRGYLHEEKLKHEKKLNSPTKGR